LPLKIVPQNAHTHPFNDTFSGTTRVSGYQKGTTSLDFTETRDSEWHQLGGAICKSALHSRQITTPAPHHSDFTGQMSFCCPTNSIKALMAKKLHHKN